MKEKIDDDNNMIPPDNDNNMQMPSMNANSDINASNKEFTVDGISNLFSGVATYSE